MSVKKAPSGGWIEASLLRFLVLLELNVGAWCDCRVVTDLNDEVKDALMERQKRCLSKMVMGPYTETTKCDLIAQDTRDYE